MQFLEPRPARPMAIRMTPLIDVVFILLVFFMLTTRLLPVNLLKVSTAEPSESSAAQGNLTPEIRVVAGERLEWKNRSYTPAELARELTGAGIARVNLTSAPDASVHDSTFALSTLNDNGINPLWRRAGETGARP